MAEDGEHEEPGGEAGAGVHHAGDQRVPVAVVVELVVRPQGGQSAGPHAANIFGMCLNIFCGTCRRRISAWRRLSRWSP